MFIIKKKNPTTDMNYSCELSDTGKSLTFDYKIYFTTPSKINTDDITRYVNSKARGIFNCFINNNSNCLGEGPIYKMSFSKNRLAKNQKSRYCGSLTIQVKNLPDNIQEIGSQFEHSLYQLSETINKTLITYVDKTC